MIQGISNTTYTPATAEQTSAAAVSTKTTTEDDTAAVYEKSSEQTSSVSSSSTDRSSIVAKLKADQESRLDSLKSLVEKLISKQGQTYAWANASNEDLMNDSSFWNAIRTGEYTVDEETAAQAQADVAEDGYWGVEQTSDRLIDFAKALTGGDSSKIESMRDAIEQGFKEAAKLWGGDLPDISQQTYDAVMEKLDAWANESESTEA